MRAIDFYPEAELTPQVQELAAEFFDKVEEIFDATMRQAPGKDRQKRIDNLISTSVDDCRATIAMMDDVDLLHDVLSHMEQNGIEGKTRRLVIARRIRAIKKDTSA